MSRVTAKAVATNPDGSVFASAAFEWGDIDAATVQDELNHLADFADKVHGHHEDNANLTCVLSSSVDGVAAPDKTLTGVSGKAFSKFVREGHKVGHDLLKELP